MNPLQFIQRLPGYRERIAHEYAIWQHHRTSRKNLDRFQRWIRALALSCPQVFLGPDLPYGGVRGHVHNIRRYSSLQVQLVPDEGALNGLENFSHEVLNHFMAFIPVGRPVVHSHVIPWMIRWCAKQQEFGSKWVHTYHNMYFPEFSRGALSTDQLEINEALIREARHADVRLSVSRWQQQYLKTAHGIETDYLPNGVDVAACDAGDEASFRRRFKLRESFALYVGRNDPVKNPTEFLLLAHALPALHFVVIGQGLDAEVMLREWGLESPSNIRYLGAVTHSGVQDALAACTALVVTSKREGLPTLVLEAMAHGKPIVVPNEAGCMEAISHAEFGFVYQLGQLDSLIMETLNAMKDVERCQRARQRVLDEYDWRVVAPRLDAIYQDALSPPCRVLESC